MALETSPDRGTVARRHLASCPFRPRGVPMPPGRVPGPVHPASPPQRAERAARNRGETASAAAPVPLLLSLVTPLCGTAKPPLHTWGPFLSAAGALEGACGTSPAVRRVPGPHASAVPVTVQ